MHLKINKHGIVAFKTTYFKGNFSFSLSIIKAEHTKQTAVEI